VPKSVALNQTDLSFVIRMITDSSNNPDGTVTSATPGLSMWYRRDNELVVTDAGAVNDLAALNTSHVDWGILHIRSGYYRVDYPDAVSIEGVGGVVVGMDATGISGDAEFIDIDPFVKFQGRAVSTTTTTTTFPVGTGPLKGDQILVVSGTGDIGNGVLITSVAGEVATHAAFSTGISSATTVIVILPGDSITADGGINADATISSRSVLTSTELDASLVNATNVSANINQVNGTTVTGDGSAPTWGP